MYMQKQMKSQDPMRPVITSLSHRSIWNAIVGHGDMANLLGFSSSAFIFLYSGNRFWGNMHSHDVSPVLANVTRLL